MVLEASYTDRLKKKDNFVFQTKAKTDELYQKLYIYIYIRNSFSLFIKFAVIHEH